MKDIFIFGPSRAGKSTLAGMISSEFGHRIIHVDGIISFLETHFPYLGVDFRSSPLKAGEKATCFVEGLYSILKQEYPRENIVVEGDRISLQILSHQYKDEAILLGLAHEKITPHELVKSLKTHDTGSDWTYGIDECSLLPIAKDFLVHSEQMVALYEEYRVPYYRTSFNRNEKLERILSQLETKKN